MLLCTALISDNIFILVICSQMLGVLYERITPVYAARWKVIGTLLGIPEGELMAIEGGYPTNLRWCCNKMLEKWLEIDPTASWEKLCAIVHSPEVSNRSFENGNYICKDYIMPL